MDDSLGALSGTLAEAEVVYALIGGHAVNAWVEPRFTADIGLTIVFKNRVITHAYRRCGENLLGDARRVLF